MTRHARRDAWRLAKADFRRLAVEGATRYGSSRCWRSEHRASWATHTLPAEGHGAPKRLLRSYDRGQERLRNDAAVQRAKEALA